MDVDARTLPEGSTVTTDVCVVGAGVAGIAIARELAGRGVRVALLESGGHDEDPAALELSRAENVGRPYAQLDRARYRRFGGGSRLWNIELGRGEVGARLRPLDPIDFEERSWVPYSGWPFGRDHLEPYYERAHEMLGLGPVLPDPACWSDPTATPLLPLGERVETTLFRFGRGDLLFDRYRREIAATGTVTTYLHASVVELVADEGGRRLEGVRVATRPGRTFLVEAKRFVLAAGGTENPRLLLASDRVHRGGIGNEYDLVGRFFMEHPHYRLGRILPTDAALLRSTGLYEVHRVRDVPVMAKLALAEEVRRAEGLLGYCVAVHPRYEEIGDPGVRAYRALREAGASAAAPARMGRLLRNARGLSRVAARRLLGRPKATLDPNVLRLNVLAEQAPNPDSRVTLADDRDALGVRRARLAWRLSPLDERSLLRGQQIVDEAFRSAGLGRLHTDHPPGELPPEIKGGWHHMGTTRMHADPRRGVVDEHGRVHGMANLYVAGSSVFPTGGYANPTLTIVALALRLADRLEVTRHEG